jgi:CheY-like chemotaxis protein
MCKAVHEEHTVGQARELVVSGRVLELALTLLALDRVVDRAQQQRRRDLALDEVVLGAAADGLGRDAAVVEAREDHDGEPTHLNVVGDGEQAMAYLRRQEPYEDRPRPQLVLLDLNLPKKDGREVLEEMKADSNLCRIPVVVLTTSAAESDISRSYELHANCYITKPLDLDEYFDVVGSIKNFWLANARLPSA